MKTFLIIDGNSIANRSFYGISTSRLLMNDEGMYTNAVYGFLATYYMIEDMIKPDYVAVTFDVSKKTFRNELYTEYKGTRKGMPDELRPQMNVIKEVLDAMNITIIEKENYEADDVIGTVSKINEDNDIFTYILTGDKDSYQLISDKTNVIMPKTTMGKTEYTIYDITKLKEKYNIDPIQVIDIKSLMGDSADNIIGVPGIGEKTAYSLIEKYYSLDNIYKNIDVLDATNSVKLKLKDNYDTAHLSYKLATIVRDVDINYNLYDCIQKQVNKLKLFNIFKKLKFNKFLSKYNFDEINNFKELNDITDLTYIDNLDNITLNNNISYILNIENIDYFTNCKGTINNSLSIYDTNKIYIIKLNANNKFDILNKFANLNITKYGSNIKQDLRYMFDLGITTFNNFNYDLVIAYYLINTNRSNYLLDNLLFDLFNKNIKEDNGTQISFFEQTDDTIDNENINLILKGIYLSYDIMYNKLKSYDMLQLFNEIEMPLIETLASMEHTGMYIDINKLNDFDIEVTEKLVNLEDTIHKITNSNFNINSPKQLGELLFEVLQLPIIKKNKNGYSTDKDVLELLKDKHEVIPYILEYRTLIKLKSTYIDGLKNKIKNNRIHTTFMQTVAETGRLSSTDPNLQNIPVRLELGSRIRSFFVAQNNYKIMDADYSQIELRILSHMSDDINLKKAFIDNIDVHTLTASEIFNVDIKDVTKEMRSKAKAINFGIVYGISDYGLAKNIDSSVSDANKYITNYLEKYSNVKVFMDKLITDARINRYVTTMFNRRRYVDEINNSNKNISKSSERISMNAPIQGTAADIIKLAMNDIYTKLKNYKSKLIMQVHDELIIEVENSEIDEIKEIMKNSMENIVKLSIPLTVDLNIGESWYDAK